MIWLTWRQFRLPAAVAAAAVLAIGVVTALTGPGVADLAEAGDSVYDRLTPTDVTLYFAGLIVVAALPALFGVFVGAPLVARELESGTHSLVWNQSVTPVRWLVVKLLVTVGAAALVTGLVSAAVTWWADPLDGATSQSRGGFPLRLTSVAYAMRGVVPAGYALFAVALGVLVGLVLRRTVPAMALTLALYVVAQIVFPLWVRPHLIPPVETDLKPSSATFDGMMIDGARDVALTLHTPDHDDWVLSQETVDGTGRATALPSWFADCVDQGVGSGHEPGTTPDDPCLARLSAEGYRQHVVYQPADRFWPLQFAETGLFVGLSVLLGAGGLLILRRRPG